MKKMKGFTLVELAVTLVVIIILMSVSVPVYKSNFDKYKKAEGYALIAAIRSAQERYYFEYGNFLCSSNGSGGNPASYNNTYWTTNENVLGINAITNKYFTSFSINGSTREPPFTIFEPGRHTTSAFVVCVTGKAGAMAMTYNLKSGITYVESNNLK